MKLCLFFMGALCAFALPLSGASAADDAPSHEGAEDLGPLVDFDLTVDINDQLCGWGHHHHGWGHHHHHHHHHHGAYRAYYRSFRHSYYHGGYGGYGGYGYGGYGYGGYGYGGYGGCY